MITNEMIKWAEDILVSNGYIINKPSTEDIQTTPWSCVKRFSTTKGYIYLKQMPPSISLEPDIIQRLCDCFQENVPIIVEKNKNLRCFLMQDSGIQLRQLFKNNFQANLLPQAIKKYTDIQHACTVHVNNLIELGVPDRIFSINI